MLNHHNNNKCSKCGIEIEENNTLWTDSDDNTYCEDCWIEHEAELKNLI